MKFKVEHTKRAEEIQEALEALEEMAKPLREELAQQPVVRLFECVHCGHLAAPENLDLQPYGYWDEQGHNSDWVTAFWGVDCPSYNRRNKTARYLRSEFKLFRAVLPERKLY